MATRPNSRDLRSRNFGRILSGRRLAYTCTVIVPAFFQSFHAALTPREACVGRARLAVASFRELLQRESPVGAAVTDVFAQGSLVHRTTVVGAAGDHCCERTPFTVDVVAVLDLPANIDAREATDRLMDGARALPGFEVHRRDRSIRVRCPGGVDLGVIAARPTDSGVRTKLEVPDHKCSRWRATDPKRLGDWYQTQQTRTGGRFARLSKMLKQWCQDDVPVAAHPPRVVIDVLLADAIAAPECDAEGVVQALDGLSWRLPVAGTIVVPNPSIPEEDLARDWSPEAISIYRRQVQQASLIARAALLERNEERARMLWKAVFRDRFPDHV